MANIKGLSDINGEGSDDENRKHNDYYAGGEKSGQLIRGAPEEDSDDEDRVGSIFQKAKAVGAKQGTVDDLPEESKFRGQSRTLAGGQGAAAQGGGQPLNHVVKFYRNHIFTVDDGPPRTMDDPANVDFINSVSKGECPQELDPGNSSAEVTVNMLRVEEDYEVPKYVAFAGSGRTLGSSSAAGASSSAAAGSSTADRGEWKGVDESQPTTSIQLRLSDGSRMVARMNTTHTVADIRRFIRAARPDMTGGYQLLTGFPPAPIADESHTLEAAGLLNAVINQRK
eukprot:GHUV01001771.1.p1 GENE.GHUV01001771.1~~GHUV01001771.1.p1  ORF type:complete len:283 (+),score=97.43 GHUV01001771.1:128-976(+)